MVCKSTADPRSPYTRSVRVRPRPSARAFSCAKDHLLCAENLFAAAPAIAALRGPAAVLIVSCLAAEWHDRTVIYVHVVDNHLKNG